MVFDVFKISETSDFLVSNYIMHIYIYIFKILTLFCSLYCAYEDMVSKFLQITFVENKKLKSILLEDVDESQLPDIYGGTLALVPIQHI